MYVRWKHRRSTAVDLVTRLRQGRHGRGGNPGNVSHSAYLVESVRVDGKPRQRTVAYLGFIAEQRGPGIGQPQNLQNPAARYWFWRDACAILDGVTMDDATRARCETVLASVVPPLVGDDLADFQARLAAFRMQHDAWATPQSR